MKTMTCAQMGGPCDTAIQGETKDEMMANGMTHVEAAHPEMVADIQAMSPDSPEMVAWQQNFTEEWDKTPEDASAAA